MVEDPLGLAETRLWFLGGGPWSGQIKKASEVGYMEDEFVVTNKKSGENSYGSYTASRIGSMSTDEGPARVIEMHWDG